MAKSETPVNTKAFLLGTPGYQAPELLLGKSPAAACYRQPWNSALAVEQQRSSLCWATLLGLFVIFFVAFMCVLVKL